MEISPLEAYGYLEGTGICEKKCICIKEDAVGISAFNLS